MKKDSSILNHVLSVLIAFFMVSFTQAAQAQDQYVGEIRMFASTYCPRTWLEADGRLLPVSQYMELYALFGNTYGGDGRINFALPDLRGRVPIGRGSAPGMADYRQGERGGQESVTLTAQQMPEHNHAIKAGEGTGKNTSQLALGAEESGELLTQPVQNNGETRPHENRPPYQVIRFCVAAKGIFPQHE